MHIASALGVPTVTVFGATDDATTGRTRPLARIIRDHPECAPGLLRECPINPGNAAETSALRRHARERFLAQTKARPDVTVFGATDDTTTGPIRDHAECAPASSVSAPSTTAA